MQHDLDARYPLPPSSQPQARASYGACRAGDPVPSSAGQPSATGVSTWPATAELSTARKRRRPLFSPLRAALIDPVSLQPLRQPYVLTDCGHTFERTTLCQLLERSTVAPRCPICRTLVVADCRPNFALRGVLEALAAGGVHRAPGPSDARPVRAPTNAEATTRAILAVARPVYGAPYATLGETLIYVGAVLVSTAACFGLAKDRPFGNAACLGLIVGVLLTLTSVHLTARDRTRALERMWDLLDEAHR